MFQMKAGVENPIAKYGISKHAAFDIFDDPCLSNRLFAFLVALPV